MTRPKAEKLIAGVLSELEKDTGQFVVRVNLNDLDITQFNSDGQQMLRHVQIELHRLPGTNWAK